MDDSSSESSSENSSKKSREADELELPTRDENVGEVDNVQVPKGDEDNKESDESVEINPSKLAERYGVLPRMFDEYGIFHSLKKSAFTPAETDLTFVESISQAMRNSWIEKAQIRLFNGFTAKDFEVRGVYSDPEATLQKLTNPIHPIFDRKLWESLSYPSRVPTRFCLPIEAEGDCYSLPKPLGFWCVDNPVVWDALEPVLRLASRIITLSHTSTFIDSFLCGEFRLIDPRLNTLRPDKEIHNGPLRSFHRRAPEDVNHAEAKSKQDKMFDVFIKKIQFGIGDAVMNWHTRTGVQDLRYHGITTGLWSDPVGHFTAEWPRVDINISRQVLQPLLRNDLSASEIMGHRWYAASLMCHEMMHAMNCVLIGTHPYDERICRAEPSFENEVFCELGRSFEINIWGGYVNTIFAEFTDDALPTNPKVGFELWSYPSPNNCVPPGGIPLLGGRINVPRHLVVRPIRCRWYEQVCDDRFWEAPVAVWGLSVLRPQIAGSATSHYDYWNDACTSREVVVNDPGGSEEYAKCVAKYKGSGKDTVQLLAYATAIEKTNFEFAEKHLAHWDKGIERSRQMQNRIYNAREIMLALAAVEVGPIEENTTDLEQCRNTYFYVLQHEVEYQYLDLSTLIRKSLLTAPSFEQPREFAIRQNRRIRKLMKGLVNTAVMAGDSNLEAGAVDMGYLLLAIGGILSGTMKSEELEERAAMITASKEGKVVRIVNCTSRDSIVESLFTEEDEKLIEGDLKRALYKAKEVVEKEEKKFNELELSLAFDLSCQIGGNADSRALSLGNIVGRILYSHTTTEEYTDAKVYRQLAKDMLEVRTKLGLFPLSSGKITERQSTTLMAKVKDIRAKFNEGAEIGSVGDAKDLAGLSKEEIADIADYWTVVIDVLIESSYAPGEKRRVDPELSLDPNTQGTSANAGADASGDNMAAERAKKRLRGPKDMDVALDPKVPVVLSRERAKKLKARQQARIIEAFKQTRRKAAAMKAKEYNTSRDQDGNAWRNGGPCGIGPKRTMNPRLKEIFAALTRFEKQGLWTRSPK